MWRERAAAVAVAAIVAATILDAVIAFKWVGPGRDPGDSTLRLAVASVARLVWVFLVLCGFTTVAEGIGH